MVGNDVERLIRLLSKLPGLGPRSARRAALHMIQKRESVMEPLAEALSATAAAVRGRQKTGSIARHFHRACAVHRWKYLKTALH